MATTSIVYNPKIGYFFNETSDLVLTDITGIQSSWNPDGWGTGNPLTTNNPSKTSILGLSLTIGVYCEGTLYQYSTSDTALVPLDLSTSGFMSANPYHVVDIADIPYLFDYQGNFIQEVSSFKTGFYLVSLVANGSFQVVLDTVNWSSGGSVQNPFGAYNLNGVCIPEVWKQAVFTRGCKPNKKAEQILRLQKMTFDYFNFSQITNTVTDLAENRFDKTTDLYLMMQGICDNKRNCQC